MNRVNEIVNQTGRGLNGGLVYVGAKQFIGQDKDIGGFSTIDDHGCIVAGCYLMFQVNGKRGQNWKIIVALEPNDTYTARLWRKANAAEARQGKIGVIIGEASDVYCDTLQGTVEEMYDAAIREFCGGLITI
jgi:hypothetical protein